MNTTDRMVTQCPDGSFCCTDMNTTCCNAGEGLWIDVANYQLRNFDPSKTTISSSAPTSTSTSRTAPAAAGITDHVSPTSTGSTSQSAKPESHPTSTGAVAGGVVGGVVVAAALLGSAGFLYRKRKARRSSMGDDSKNRRTLHEAPGESAPVNRWQVAEKDAAEPPAEMDGGSQTKARNVELEGTPLVEESSETGKDTIREDYYAPESKKSEYKSQIAERLALANDGR